MATTNNTNNQILKKAGPKSVEELQRKAAAREFDQGSKAPNKAGEITDTLVDLAKNHSTDRKYFS